MPELPTQTILAALTGATESPISEGGKWAILPWAVNAGEVHGSGAGYTAATAAIEVNGAYWTPAEYLYPAASWTVLFPENIATSYFALWVATATASHNGYRIKAQPVGSAGKFNLALQKSVGGTMTLLGETKEKVLTAKDRLGVSVTPEGKVISWYKSGEAGAWEVLNEAADSTYTTGRVAMEASSVSSSFGQVNVSVGQYGTGALMPIVV